MKLKNIIHNFFSISNSEKKGYVYFFGILLLIIILPQIIGQYFIKTNEVLKSDQQILDSLLSLIEMNETINNKKDIYYHNYQTKTSEKEVVPKISKFKFNPNESSQEELLKLGFSKFTSKIILNFRNKGGRFYKKSDLLKIYSVDSNLYLSLKDFIELPDSNTKFYPKKENPILISKKSEPININQADSSTIDKIPGFGTKLSIRVIKYRDKLGGFITQNQYKEIFGLDSFQLANLSKNTFIEPNFEPNKIELKGDCFEILKKHPYIGYKNAKILSSYIKMHGEIYHREQLKSIQGIDEQDIVKMTPYLKIN